MSNDENKIVENEDIIRTDAKRKVKGEAVYGFDYATKAKQKFGDDLVYIDFKTCPHAHAKITNIDKEKAEEMDGVIKVYTYKDVPDVEFTTAGQAYPEPSPYDTKILNKVAKFAGEPVVLIAAESEEVAEEAKNKIDVEYEKLEAVLDPEKSLEEEVKIHEDGNLADHLDVEVGDTEKAFNNSEVVIEDEYKTPIQKHGHMEPLACVSHLNDHGQLVVETSNQVVYHVRRIISRILDKSQNDVRVRSWEIGGGFGDKQEMNIEHYNAFVTDDIGRPSILIFDREDQFLRSRRRHSAKLRVKIGSDKNGKIDGIKIYALSDTGAYGSHGTTVTINMGSMTLPLYTKNCRNLRFEADVVYTNKPISGAYRGYGTIQGGYALEQAIDVLSEELGIDPVELRLKNTIQEGQVDPVSKVLSEGGEVIPREIKSCGLDETLEKGKEMFDWEEKREISGQTDENGRKRGVGVASAMKGSGVAGFELGASLIKMNEDGTVLITIGASDIGQGAESAMSQIAAETIGIKLEDTEIVSADTDRTMFDMGTYASSVTYVTGNAVEKAAKELRDKIIDRASEMLDKNPEDLKTEDGKVFVKEKPNESIEIEEVVMDVVYGEGERDQLYGFGKAEDFLSPPPFTTHFVEVAVDEETGEVDIERYLTLSDVGTAINPKEVEGQVEGGTAQAIGFAMTEEMIFNEEGQLRNPTFTDYKIPTSLDIPDIETEIVETHEPSGPYGAKSVGEIGIVPPAPAIANAIKNATGKRFKELPMTKEKLAKEFGLKK